MTAFSAKKCLNEARWRKSSRSATNAHCVEVAAAAEVVGVRDTKDRDGGTLVFTAAQWSSFTTRLKYA
jgi:hypothetical protein